MGERCLVLERGRAPDVSWGWEWGDVVAEPRYWKRLYLRRRGAHCCWASPIIRMSDRGSWETWAVDGLISVDKAPGAVVVRS